MDIVKLSVYCLVFLLLSTQFLPRPGGSWVDQNSPVSK
jgi:hypothetical protein